MPMSARTTLLAAATIPLAVAAAAPASAAETTDVIFAFTVDGSTVTNTITNNSGTIIGCGTSLAPAPDRVLPPVRDVLSAGQSLYERSRTDTDPAMWISDYPGIEDYLAQWPGTEFTVQQASTVVTVAVAGEDPAPPAAGDAPDVDDLGTIFGS
ncbi:hypothetical protein ACNJ7E_14370 [Rhodococcus sp. NM-2]|uniref:hypothetical protein n=1 Tax=Rhodococcus TaxID=1827 RepID=UPI00247368BB|nr:hypothetical protein [Rhodococcus opacus]MDH6287148.1 hypothetical protein [Rhodococcus opacus]